MEKIGLINTYSTYNIGDSAIYSAIAGLTPEKKVLGVIQDDNPLFTPGLEVVDNLGKCKLYISVGGDIFNNARPKIVTKTFLKNLQMLRQNPKKTFVFGQSIPASCHSFSFKLLNHTFKRLSAVVVRDALSHQRLTRAGVAARLSYDLAFSLSIQDDARILAKKTYADLDLNPNNSVLISLRKFDQMYPHDNAIFINKLAKLCGLLQQKNKQPVLLVQSDAYGTDSDWQVAKTIQSKTQSVPIINAFANHPSIANWAHLTALLELADIVIGVRYHTVILRLISGKMAFNLFYSLKGQDLSNRLNLPGVGVAEFDPQQHLSKILATAKQTFDVKPIAEQVQTDFNWAYEATYGL